MTECANPGNYISESIILMQHSERPRLRLAIPSMPRAPRMYLLLLFFSNFTFSQAVLFFPPRDPEGAAEQGVSAQVQRP